MKLGSLVRVRIFDIKTKPRSLGKCGEERNSIKAAFLDLPRPISSAVFEGIFEKQALRFSLFAGLKEASRRLVGYPH